MLRPTFPVGPKGQEKFPVPCVLTPLSRLGDFVRAVLPPKWPVLLSQLNVVTPVDSTTLSGHSFPPSALVPACP